MSQAKIHNVQIHLTIHQDGEDIRVDFDFDTEKDNIDDVVGELVNTCNLTQEDSIELKQMIQQQINKKTQSHTVTNSPFEPLSVFEDLNESDSDVRDDPEYRSLLNSQKSELEALEAQHMKEQEELSNKLQKEQSQSHSTDDLIIF